MSHARHNCCVLVIDDTRDTRHAVAAVLEARGYDVVMAVDGRDALDLLTSGLTPCVILLDIVMPVMDGWEFRHRQLHTSALASIPVVVMSATSPVDERAHELGIVDVVRMPMDLMDRLVAVVDRYCRPVR